MACAPIALFVYNRLDHTRRTVGALRMNELSSESELFVFSDAARSEAQSENVREVRKYISEIEGFKAISIIERETNFGLAHSIVDGVSEVVNKHGRIIVLEDDVVTSTDFLVFMNNALDVYANEPRVWHISAWNYPIAPEGMPDAFFWRLMNCWGWATWADRWSWFQKDPAKLIQTWDSDKIKRFNLDGAHNFWAQVIANSRGNMNTWAVFWYATIFEHDGLCLNPTRSFVRNIGLDSSGENCGSDDIYMLNTLANMPCKLPDCYEESKLMVQRAQTFYKKTRGGWLLRILRHIRIFSWKKVMPR